MLKKTLVLGASLKPERYSNLAIRRLRSHDQPVVAVGLREGIIDDVKVLTGMPPLEGIHTISVYMNAKNQQQFQEYMLGLKPSRIIFNPGAENPVFAARAAASGIEVEEACTLVMLSIDAF